MRKPRLMIVALLSAGALVAGCGGGDSEPADTPATTTASAGGDTAAGKTVFGENCAGCHTLADAGATGTVGPNLDERKPTEAAVADKVTNGGGPMPAFGVDGKLTEAQIADVAVYVSSVAGK